MGKHLGLTMLENMKEVYGRMYELVEVNKNHFQVKSKESNQPHFYEFMLDESVNKKMQSLVPGDETVCLIEKTKDIRTYRLFIENKNEKQEICLRIENDEKSECTFNFHGGNANLLWSIKYKKSFEDEVMNLNENRLLFITGSIKESI